LPCMQVMFYYSMFFLAQGWLTLCCASVPSPPSVTLTHSLTHLLTEQSHSLTYSLAHSFTHSLFHSLAHTHWSLSLSLSHSHTHSHSLTHSLTHSLSIFHEILSLSYSQNHCGYKHCVFYRLLRV
jgi:hypothetical protein